MLGWMLRRDDAPAGGDGDDTTQIDQPDTPAPVFAARAFKSALFGTPARREDEPGPSTRAEKPASRAERGSRTPPKPQGILLTPGTGTARRKRVSFGHDVKKSRDPIVRESEVQRNTRLCETLEKSRRHGATSRRDPESDDEWEEEADDEDYCNHDFTVDLNEPHSESGKFWKEEYEKYHEDAKVQMEKMLRYKQLAKSYAKQKDAEAIELAEKLKEEQRKVVDMEKKIADGASQIAARRGRASDETSPELLQTLTTQTALAVQYRTRVQELEEQLQRVLNDRDGEGDGNGRRRRLMTSPRTQRTLLETQRELRRARNQVKELGELKDQVKSLKSQLRAAERRATELAAKKATEEAPRESPRAQELRVQLREVKEESKKKDEELRQLKQELEDFRKETRDRDEDTKGVLERAHDKISELKKEIKTLKAVAPVAPELTSRPKSWHQESYAMRARDLVTKPSEPVSRTTSNSNNNTNGVQSFDLLNLNDGDSTDLDFPIINPVLVRQKQHDAVVPKATHWEIETKPLSASLGDRPTLEKPRWQPFVPRSPRNRAYLSEDVTKRIENGGGATPAEKPKQIVAPDLPALAKTVASSSRTRADDVKVDLLGDRYARLGAPEANNVSFLANTSRSKLPPERRAAAIARIERRMAEKKRAQRPKGMDKENVRP